MVTAVMLCPVILRVYMNVSQPEQQMQRVNFFACVLCFVRFTALDELAVVLKSSAPPDSHQPLNAKLQKGDYCCP